MPEETFLLSRVMNNLSPEWKLRISPTAPIKAQSLLRLGFLLLWYNPLQIEITVRLIFSPSGNMNMRSWCKLFLWLLCFAEGKKNSISLSDPENFSSMLLCVCVCFQFSSVAQPCPILRPHWLQHTRPPCPSPTPRVYSNSCPLSQWCHPTISSSVVSFSSCPQSSPASGSFQMSQLFTWGGQSIRVSASASVLPMNIQDWFLLEWTGWISLLSKGLSRVFSNTMAQKHQFFSPQISLWSTSHIHTWLLGKP